MFGSPSWSNSKTQTDLEERKSKSGGDLNELQLTPVEFTTWTNTCALMVDEGNSGHVVRVSRGEGFQPHVVTVQKGSSVYWMWDDGCNKHNVFRVEPPDDKVAK